MRSKGAMGLRSSSPPTPADRARGLFRRAREAWPLNLTGATVLLLSAASLFVGRREMDLVMSLAGLWGLVIVGATGLAAGLGALVFGRRLAARLAGHGGSAPLEGVAGHALPTGFDLGRGGLGMLVARPTLSWVEPPATVERPTRRATRETVRPLGRDAFEAIVRRWTVEDVFGFWSFGGRIAEERRGLILPDTGRLGASELISCLSRGDLFPYPFGPARGDRVDSRPYTRSDPARFILWKVYAHSRELLVRAPETARSPEERPILYFLAGPEDEPAAGAARLLWESALLGAGARFACAGLPEPSDEASVVLPALARSRRLRGRALADLRSLLREASVDAGDPLLVACPASISSETLGELFEIVSLDPQRFVFLAVGDAAAPRGERRWWRHLVRDDTGKREVTLDDMGRGLAPLAASGARVLLADRISGTTRVLASGSPGETLWQSA